MVSSVQGIKDACQGYRVSNFQLDGLDHWMKLQPWSYLSIIINHFGLGDD